MVERRPISVITGGAGFLGSHMSDRLLSAGHRLICVDNLRTGNIENVSHLENNSDFILVHHDASKSINIDKLLPPNCSIKPGSRIDYVLHLASPASPKDYANFPIETLEVGSIGTQNVIRLAMKHGSRLLLASSSEIYGDPQVTPQTEDYFGHVNPVGPRSVYDEAKRFSETLVSAYHRTTELDARIARIFNTYGPRMRPEDGRVVPTFVSQAIANKPITIFGDGSQTRSLCYIDDTVEGLFRLLTVELHAERGVPIIVNIGNPDEVTVLEIAKEILELVGSDSEIYLNSIPLPQDDPKLRCPEISRARRILQWEPTVHRRDGFRKTITYFSRLAAGRQKRP